jgi:lysophospholipase L1-like esterase
MKDNNMLNSISKFMGRTSICLGLAMFCASCSAVAEPSQDWANLQAYRQKNEAIKSLDTVHHRVVFMGDSITEFWDEAQQKLFSNKAYVNRGISGQTTPQMLLRFRQDVIALQPEAVVILAGTNDIAGNSGPVTKEMITDNIASMTELAHANNIKVVLGAVLPAASYPWAPEIQPIPRIAELNRWLRHHAEEHGFTFIDFYNPMVNAQGALKPEFTADGVHPNAAGYELMTSLVRASLSAVVKSD